MKSAVRMPNYLLTIIQFNKTEYFPNHRTIVPRNTTVCLQYKPKKITKIERMKD